MPRDGVNANTICLHADDHSTLRLETESWMSQIALEKTSNVNTL